MISSTISVSSSEALLPVNLPDQSQAPSHVTVIEGENIIAYARALYTSLDDPSITEGSTQQFTVTGTYSDETSQVLTDVAWLSSLTTIATIDANGLATGISVGSTTITANSGELEDTTSLVITAASEDPTTVSISSITYSTEGGKNSDKHLIISIHVTDDLGNDVSGGSVSIDLYRDGSLVGSATGTISSTGNVGFSLKNSSSGTYTTTITEVTASGLTWDGITPPNSFTK